MASAAIAPTNPADTTADHITSLESIRAPFVLRCAALFLDYLILLIFPCAWLVTGKLVTETGQVVIGTWVWIVSFILFIGNFVLLPLLRGRTAGKMILGLTILNMDGTPLTIGNIIKRNILGYLATAMTLGIGFLMGAVNSSGRSLHDLIAGTIVVRGRRTRV